MLLEPQNGLWQFSPLLLPLSQQHTLQSSAATSGLSCPLASNTCPFQALKRTAFSEGFSEEPSRQTEVFRQWMVMCCTTSELSRRRKFIWTLPMSKSSCKVTEGSWGHPAEGLRGAGSVQGGMAKGVPVLCFILHKCPELDLM